MSTSCEVFPKVVIGVPVYNEARYISKTLECLLAQDYPNFEIFVCDNASTDETWTICQSYAAKDKRLVLNQHDHNIGASANFQATFEKSPDSKYFMWAAGHDQYEPNFVSACVEVLQSNSDIILAYPNAQSLEPDGTTHAVLTPPIDTRGLRNFDRMMTMLWGLHNCYPFYGLYVRAALQQINLRPGAVAPDVAILAELSLIGFFAHTSKTTFYLRCLSDEGSFAVQMAKLGETIEHPYRLFFRFWKNIMKAILRRTNDPTTRAGLLSSATICLLLKYWWIPTQMDQEKRAKSASLKVSCANNLSS